MPPHIGEFGAEHPAQAFARREDRIGIDERQLVADEALGRQQHRLGDEGGVEIAIAQRIGDRGDHRTMVRPPLDRTRHQRIEHQLLHRLVAGERIVVMAAEEGEVGGAAIAFDDHRRRKAAVDRQDGAFGNAVEHDRARRRVQQHQPLRPDRLARLRAEQADLQRQHHRLLRLLARCRGDVLGKAQRGTPLARLMAQAGGDARGAGLAVPQTKLGKIDAARLFHAGDEILARRRRAVEAAEIQIGRGAERLGAQDRRHHADQLGALVVDGRRVEVTDLEVAFGTHRMRERAGILGELRRTQAAHVLDPLDRRRTLVRRKALVAIDGEAFLQRQLEPVAAGDAVARPIVEIFVRHHRGDRVIIVIGGRVGIGEDVAAVEDVQPLVLHRAEVEIVDRHDVEHVEVVFAAIDAFVPRHRQLQGVERMMRLVDIGGADPDAQRDLAARLRDETTAIDRQIPCDDREQIAGFGEGIVPLRPMPAILQVAATDGIAIGEQHRIARLIRHQPHAVAAQHVGPVGEVGDPAKAFRLALRTQDAAAGVQAHQLRVAFGGDLHLGLDNMRVAGQRHDQLLAFDPPVAHRKAIDAHRQQFLPRPVEPQRLARTPIGIAHHRQRRRHPRRGGIQIEHQPRFGHGPGRRPVIVPTDRRGGRGDGGLGDAVGNVEHESFIGAPTPPASHRLRPFPVSCHPRRCRYAGPIDSRDFPA